MTDERYTFEQARIRLEEIAAEVRKKDTSLERSLDLLEEGVRLANICTELVDHPDLSASSAMVRPGGEGDGMATVEDAGEPRSAEAAEDGAPVAGEDAGSPTAGAEAEGGAPDGDPDGWAGSPEHSHGDLPETPKDAG